MLLAIDVGNTQTVIGLFDLGEGVDGNRREPARRFEGRFTDGIVDRWRIATRPERTSDELVLVIQDLLALHDLDLDDIGGVAIASVVPQCTAVYRELTTTYFELRPIVIEPGVKTGMPLLTENPREVGADRIANAVAALSEFGGPAVVIDFGTATTFDALSARGEHLGGMIAPGLDIALDALYTRTAALRRVELVEPRAVIGRTTVQSIQAGAVFGTAGMVDGICRRLILELGDEPVVVATGGLAELIAPHTESIRHVEPWLTLHGLRVIFERNR